MSFGSNTTPASNAGSVTSDLLVDLAYPRMLFFELSNFASWINSSSPASRGAFVCVVNRNGAEITVQNWGDFELTAAVGSMVLKFYNSGRLGDLGQQWLPLLTEGRLG